MDTLRVIGRVIAGIGVVVSGTWFLYTYIMIMLL